jgi:hypothetical protein
MGNLHLLQRKKKHALLSYENNLRIKQKEFEKLEVPNWYLKLEWYKVYTNGLCRDLVHQVLRKVF